MPTVGALRLGYGDGSLCMLRGFLSRLQAWSRRAPNGGELAHVSGASPDK